MDWVFFCFSFFFFLWAFFSSSVSSSFAGTTRAFLTTSVKSRQARVAPNKQKERANMKDLLLRSSRSFRFTALRHDSLRSWRAFPNEDGGVIRRWIFKGVEGQDQLGNYIMQTSCLHSPCTLVSTGISRHYYFELNKI